MLARPSPYLAFIQTIRHYTQRQRSSLAHLGNIIIVGGVFHVPVPIEEQFGAVAVKLTWLLPLTVVSVLGLAQEAWAGQLTYWKFNPKLSRIEIVTDAGTSPKAVFLTDPVRLVIDLPNTSVSKFKQKRQKRVTKYIREVRVGQLNPSTTRIVVELRQRYTLQPRNVLVRSLSPNRWYVQMPSFLSVRTVNAKAQSTTPISVPAPTPAPTAGSGTPLPPPGSASPLPTPSPAAPSPRPVRPGATVVVIDPGHGGADAGAVGINGLQEKNVVLSISTQVTEKLRRQGINAVLTRRGDQEIDLAPRVATAEGARARVFVSIHANAISMSRPDINGVETYYYASSEGYRLARSIHSQILRSLSVTDRGVRQARFYVLRNTSMPAVLVETGFVTGAQDARNLASSAYRTKLAEAITQGILAYLK